MTTERFSPEQNMLRVMRKVLASVVKDVTPQDGMDNPLSARTIEEIRDIFGLISLREQELLQNLENVAVQRPQYAGEQSSAQVVPINIGSLTASRKKAESDNPLAGTELFRGVDMDAIDSLLDGCPLYELKPGEALLDAGETNNNLFLVLAGKFQVGVGGGTMVFEAGRSIGEISALGESTMAAAVVAAEESLVLAIDPERLWAMIDKDPALARNILGLLAQR